VKTLCSIEDSITLIGISNERAFRRMPTARFAVTPFSLDSAAFEDFKKKLWKFNRPSSSEQTKIVPADFGRTSRLGDLDVRSIKHGNHAA
jgi:hypothetical protein